MFTEFLWEGKPPRIAYDTLIGVVEKVAWDSLMWHKGRKCLRVKLVKEISG